MTDDTHKFSKTLKSKQLKKLQQRLLSTLSTTHEEQRTDASILIAISNEVHPKVLLTRRASHLNSHAGEVSFPGGKYELGDSDNSSTALREAHEETQIDINKLDIIGKLKTQISKAGLSVTPIVAVVTPDQKLVAEKNEIAHIFWVDLSWLLNTEPVEYIVNVNKQDKPIKIQTLCWEFMDENIWGLTAHIIADLLAVGFDKKVVFSYNVIV